MCRNCVRSADGKRLTNYPELAPAGARFETLTASPSDVDFAAAYQEFQAWASRWMLDNWGFDVFDALRERQFAGGARTKRARQVEGK